MAALPKKKVSKTRGRTRRAHNKTTLPGLTKCPNCGAPKRPHSICPECGWYKGRKVVKTKLDAKIASRMKTTAKPKAEAAPKSADKPKTTKKAPAAKKTTPKEDTK